MNTDQLLIDSFDNQWWAILVDTFTKARALRLSQDGESTAELDELGLILLDQELIGDGVFDSFLKRSMNAKLPRLSPIALVRLP